MLRIAVLGCGRIGRMHAANIAAHPRARLAAVYDIDRQSARFVWTSVSNSIVSFSRTAASSV